MPKTYKVVDPAELDPRGGPRQLVRAADAAGYTVEVHRLKADPTVVAVGGINAEAGLAFVGTWHDGKTVGAVLYDEVDRGYREEPAPERVQVGKSSATRPTGYVGGVRLVYLGGPRGVRLSITELKGRMTGS